MRVTNRQEPSTIAYSVFTRRSAIGGSKRKRAGICSAEDKITRPDNDSRLCSRFRSEILEAVARAQVGHKLALKSDRNRVSCLQSSPAWKIESRLFPEIPANARRARGITLTRIHERSAKVAQRFLRFYLDARVTRDARNRFPSFHGPLG